MPPQPSLQRTAAGLLTAVIVGAACPLLDAQTYDLAGDWSNSQNPNGVWSYNDGALPIASHQSAWAPWAFSGDQPAWALQASGNGHIPAIYKLSQPLLNGPWDVQLGDVIMHGNDATNGTQGGLTHCNVTWTSPAQGALHVDGGTWMIHETGRSMNWRLLFNGSVMQSGSLFDGDPFDRGNPASFSLALTVAAGDVVQLEFERTSTFGWLAAMNMSVDFAACTTPASWIRYGSGHPGTLGTPDLVALSQPVLGQPLQLQLSNSSTTPTLAFLFVGLVRNVLPTSLGGNLLLDPIVVLPALPVPVPSLTLNGALLLDDTLCDQTINLQALLLDPGASSGVAFSRGLELVPGI